MSSTPQARLERVGYPVPDWRSYRLTQHFQLGEFIRDQSKAPSVETMRMARRFAIRLLEPLRSRYGPCAVISGHRTPQRNRQVGGAPRSWHVWEWHPGEMAVDVVFRRGNPSLWAAAAEETAAGGIGRYRAHLHLDDRPERVRWTSTAE